MRKIRGVPQITGTEQNHQRGRAVRVTRAQILGPGPGPCGHCRPSLCLSAALSLSTHTPTFSSHGRDPCPFHSCAGHCPSSLSTLGFVILVALSGLLLTDVIFLSRAPGASPWLWIPLTPGCAPQCGTQAAPHGGARPHWLVTHQPLAGILERCGATAHLCIPVPALLWKAGTVRCLHL